VEREEHYRGIVKEVELAIEETPKRQEELSTLERDLRMMHRQYESLLVKMQNARMAENLERKQKGEQFRVLNTAQIPTNPIEPNRSKLILFSFFLSFMFGMALGVLVEVSDHSLRDSASAQSLIGLPMLATIPKLVLDTERVRKAVLRRSILITASTMGVLMVGSLGLLFLIRTGRLG
jgi:hypothetical protein